MHVPGVKQEQPDRKEPIKTPLFVDFVVRDGDNTRVLKASGKRPDDVVRILNSLLRKMDRKGNFQVHEVSTAESTAVNEEEIVDEQPALAEESFALPSRGVI